MTQQMSDDEADDQGGLFKDALALIAAYGRFVILTTGLVTAVVMALGVAYYVWGQPVRRSSVLEFRPTFPSAKAGKYPNGLPFSPTDVTAGPIVDAVFDANAIKEYCDREVFRSGFFVEQRSDGSDFLQAEYQAKLSETRLTSVERDRLQAEYEAKRASLPLQYRLIFLKPLQCQGIPQVAVAKSLADLLVTWASESETKRGVLKQQMEILTPAILEVPFRTEGSRLLRADLLRTALNRVVRNIVSVEALPGASLVRGGNPKMSFLEVQDQLVDLSKSRLEPLAVTIGQSVSGESQSWVAETVAAAEREKAADLARAAAYATALQQYSGQMPSGADRALANGPVNPRDFQTATPQIDRSFIDRIVEMSEANVTFRQDLTRSMVDQQVSAVSADERVGYYKNLLKSMSGNSGVRLTPAEVDARLRAIADEAKALTVQFNALYDEYSRMALRPSASLYQVSAPVTTEVSRQFSRSGLLSLVAVTFFVTFVFTLGYAVLRDRIAATRA